LLSLYAEKEVKIFHKLKSGCPLSNIFRKVLLSLLITLLFVSQNIYSYDANLSIDGRLIRNSFKNVCSSIDISSLNLDDQTINSMCEIIKESSLCRSVNEEDLRECNLKKEGAITSSLDLLSGCAKGLFDSVSELLGFIWSVMKFAWKNTTSSHERRKNQAIASSYMESTKLYLLTEYEKAYQDSSSPFRKAKALGEMGESIANLILGLVQSAVEKEVQEFACLNTEAKSKYTCKLIGDLFIPPAIALALIKKGPIALKSYSTVSDSLSDIKKSMGTKPKAKKEPRVKLLNTDNINNKQELLGRFLNYKATTPLENQKWIDSAKLNSSSVYVDVENGALKRLNDSLGDKNLVTSLTNLHKNIFLTELDKFTKKYPDLDLNYYSDFKSMRLAIGTKLTPEQALDLKKVFSISNKEFSKKVESISGLKELKKEDSSKWFSAGLGETADEAGLSVRKAREYTRTESPANIVSFEKIKKDLSNSLDDADKKRETFVKLMEKQDKNNHFLETSDNKVVPTREFFEVMRKQTSKSNKKVASFIRQKYGTSLSPEDVQKLKDYHQSVDQFSPGIWVKERVVANLDNANNGGFSADFAGMGAENLRQVAVDISHNSKNIDNALVQIRKGEKQVTTLFDKKKKEFDTLANDGKSAKANPFEIKCSGDDCIAIPKESLSLSDKKSIINNFAKKTQPDSMRISFIPEKVQRNHRSVIAVHGELIEKAIRANITGIGGKKISSEKMKKVLLALDMPKQQGRGKVNLIIGKGANFNFTDKELEIINEVFKESVRTVNKELTTDIGKKVKYSSEIIIQAN